MRRDRGPGWCRSQAPWSSSTSRGLANPSDATGSGRVGAEPTPSPGGPDGTASMRPCHGCPAKRGARKGWAPCPPSRARTPGRALIRRLRSRRRLANRARDAPSGGTSRPVRQSAPRPRDVGRRDGGRPVRGALGPHVPRTERLAPARIGHRGARRRLPPAHLHGLPRLRARLVLPSRRANVWLGTALGLVVFTPFQSWRQNHAIHHATAGDLERRGVATCSRSPSPSRGGRGGG